MHGGNRTLAVKQKSAISVYVGISSLILEGRALGGDCDEEFPRSQPDESSMSDVRHEVKYRISEKLMHLRPFPGTSKELDVFETPVASHDFEHQSRLYHVAPARNIRLTSIPIPTTSNSSSAASVFHEIDVDYNDISILLNGLDSIVKVPSFPLKIPSSGRSSQRLIASNSSSAHTHPLKPKQGPHCEKFLKKLGLIKHDSPDSDHMCNHINSYVSSAHFEFLVQQH